LYNEPLHVISLLSGIGFWNLDKL